MGTLAGIAVQPLKQGRGVDAGSESEIFATDCAVAAGIAEIQTLAYYGAWDLHLDLHIILGNAHIIPPVPI
jgi:hypothetical protein